MMWPTEYIGSNEQCFKDWVGEFERNYHFEILHIKLNLMPSTDLENIMGGYLIINIPMDVLFKKTYVENAFPPPKFLIF